MLRKTMANVFLTYVLVTVTFFVGAARVLFRRGGDGANIEGRFV
jgi:hypothetical protein